MSKFGSKTSKPCWPVGSEFPGTGSHAPYVLVETLSRAVAMFVLVVEGEGRRGGCLVYASAIGSLPLLVTQASSCGVERCGGEG